jgi:hypothetical protein
MPDNRRSWTEADIAKLKSMAAQKKLLRSWTEVGELRW